MKGRLGESGERAEEAEKERSMISQISMVAEWNINTRDERLLERMEMRILRWLSRTSWRENLKVKRSEKANMKYLGVGL